MEHFSYDLLILGCGAAGLRAAIAAAEKKVRVCVCSKVPKGLGTATVLSRGHFAGARDDGDPEGHRASTLQAGRGINQLDLVEVLIEEGPERLDEIVGWGLPAQMIKGHLYTIGRPPVWGKEIAHCLFARAQSLGVQFISGLVASKIWMSEGTAGVLAYSAERSDWVGFTSRSLVLATGGAGALYLRHDNPQRMLGEGYTLALEAGATLQDMEFIQFLPLALAEPNQPQLGIPSTVARRGILVNSRGEELLGKYGIHERPADQLARDRLSQALFHEIHRNGEEAFLDLRGISEEEWGEDALTSSIEKILCSRYGARQKPLRVAPTAHYSVGGVCINPRGETHVPGLFAAGEVTGGLHGANRMGGNSLTETLVFGARAGEAAASWAKDCCPGGEKRVRLEILSFLPEYQKGNGQGPVSELKKRLQKILWEDGGILRNKEGLIRALGTAGEIRDEALRLSLTAHPGKAQEILELQLGSQTSLLILEAALRREESRGAHYREDFPNPDDRHWRGHLHVSLSAGKQKWTFAPVSDNCHFGPGKDYVP